jgi:hypothetical protein
MKTIYISKGVMKLDTVEDQNTIITAYVEGHESNDALGVRVISEDKHKFHTILKAILGKEVEIIIKVKE